MTSRPPAEPPVREVIWSAGSEVPLRAERHRQSRVSDVVGVGLALVVALLCVYASLLVLSPVGSTPHTPLWSAPRATARADGPEQSVAGNGATGVPSNQKDRGAGHVIPSGNGTAGHTSTRRREASSSVGSTGDGDGRTGMAKGASRVGSRSGGDDGESDRFRRGSDRSDNSGPGSRNSGRDSSDSDDRLRTRAASEPPRADADSDTDSRDVSEDDATDRVDDERDDAEDQVDDERDDAEDQADDKRDDAEDQDDNRDDDSRDDARP